MTDIYLKYNLITLMILSALAVMMFLNRKEKIPAVNLFSLGITLLLSLTVLDSVSFWTQSVIPDTFEELNDLIKIRTLADTTAYIFRPLIIMIEVFLVIPEKKYRLLCSVPAIMNTAVYSTSYFGSNVTFFIGWHNDWHGGPLSITVYVVQIFYLLLLLFFSVRYFTQKNIKRSIIILTIFLQSVTIAITEHMDILTNQVNTVTALCILEYYIYLSSIYQQEMKDMITQKELEITRGELLILRNQIQPHFIYNSLSIIRSMAKRDSAKAVSCIDDFSEYLRAHINAIKNDDMVPFAEELENVSIYLSLVQVDYSRKVEIRYDLNVTNFTIPPLLLEPIVENAVEHGISRSGGRLTIATDEIDGVVTVSISDNGTAAADEGEKKALHTGIGLANTRRRLEMQCGGTLEMNTTENGTTVTMTIPQNRKEQP
ncbi:histidine kinase [Ruminococcus sp.]|uniref:sensor histidine kinase n=1 Tax=Ruminococcus sp. TaxID=41978 RepID=UPI0025E1D325|nr:histidine kinase [Ruminococcus sp.]MBQ8967402.1 histidine kinase [Ruminococcus sp.]